MTTFRHPLPNAWSQTLQASKRHTFRVSAFHRCHWFGVKLFPVGCAQGSAWTPQITTDHRTLTRTPTLTLILTPTWTVHLRWSAVFKRDRVRSTVEGYPKREKMLCLDMAPLTLQNSGFFTIAPPHLHFDGLPPKSRRSVVSIRFYKYYKNIVVLVWPGVAHAPIVV